MRRVQVSDLVNHPLHCDCGSVQGYVVPSASATRAVCYCRDCQAFARFIGTLGTVDEKGGTEVVASLPYHVHLTRGVGKLACISLRDNGLYRWYAACCRTPVANTPRSRNIPYVGIIHRCLEKHQPSLEATFGPIRLVVNTKSARSGVEATSNVVTLARVLGLAVSALGATVSGASKTHPFFAPGANTPIHHVHVLTPHERAQAYES